MKLYIKHADTDRVKEIVEKLVNAAGRSILIEKPDLDKELINKVIYAVKSMMSDTMDTLLRGSDSTVIKFDIETAVGQSFENIAKMVKWEKDNGFSDSEPKPETETETETEDQI